MWVTLSPPSVGVSQIVLKVNDNDPCELACRLQEQESLESARQPALLLGKADSNGKRDNLVRVAFTANATTGQRALLRLHWQADQEQKPDLVLLSVGVGQYGGMKPGDPCDLPCATADAADLMKAFQCQEPSLFQRVLIHPELKGPAIDCQATRAELFSLLRWVKDTATSNSNCIVLVTLSGHGVKVDNDRYFFCAHGFDPQAEAGVTAFSWEDFHQYLHGLPCPVIIVLDTCHSGVIGVRDIGFDAKQELRKAVDAAWKELAGARSGLVIIAACRGDQSAHEDPKWKHGALTLAILELLRGERLYDAPRDSKVQPYSDEPVVTLKHLERYAEDRVEELVKLVGGKQAVEVKYSEGLRLRDIPLAARNKATAAASAAAGS
jgi:uncharacterized caspase-like protein